LDGDTYLYYSGASDLSRFRGSIGLATSSDGIRFSKLKDPVLEYVHGSFCSRLAITPVVFQVSNRFFMVFAGSSLRNRKIMSIGIAWADDPKGPFRVIGELIRPSAAWEGFGIDCGPGVVRMSEDCFLVFYSNNTCLYREYLRNALSLFFRSGVLPFSLLRDPYRYVRRRIGVLKVRVRGTSRWSVEAFRYRGNPLVHLNGPWGAWNESLFCPGCLRVGDYYYLFPAASTYSVGFPYRQYIGVFKSGSPFFERVLVKGVWVNGPAERGLIMPSARGELALDTPCPVLMDNGRVYLYYSVMDRYERVWRTALSVFDVRELP